MAIASRFKAAIAQDQVAGDTVAVESESFTGVGLVMFGLETLVP
jgi:hypothetical protein